ncbi:MAG: glycosyltransferase, partial [Proteobacteria bacterium]|nr:glycosyltransferase [Pseudomonadota bacterium]
VAFRRIADELPDARYEIFGDGPERARLEAEAGALGIADRIDWRGAAPYPQILEALRRCHLHLFTTIRSATGRTEGVPNILKETQAAGLPAVCFAHPGVDEVVEHGRTGLIVPQGDAPALASAALRVLSDPALATDLGSAAETRARSLFDLAAITDRLEGIYRAAVDVDG